MTSLALPLPRARRRRRKPPGPRFWWALVNVLVDVGFIAVYMGRLATGHDPAWSAILVVAGALWLTFDWPPLVREWRRWREDDE